MKPNEPMAFVNVQIVDTTDGAVTGRDGRFAFSTKHFGPRDLSASFIGFEPTRQTLAFDCGRYHHGALGAAAHSH